MEEKAPYNPFRFSILKILIVIFFVAFWLGLCTFNEASMRIITGNPYGLPCL
jgi:hypothetical protein